MVVFLIEISNGVVLTPQPYSYVEHGFYTGGGRDRSPQFERSPNAKNHWMFCFPVSHMIH